MYDAHITNPLKLLIYCVVITHGTGQKTRNSDDPLKQKFFQANRHRAEADLPNLKMILSRHREDSPNFGILESKMGAGVLLRSNRPAIQVGFLSGLVDLLLTFCPDYLSY